MSEFAIFTQKGAFLWHMTHDVWHIKNDKRYMTHNIFFFSFCIWATIGRHWESHCLWFAVLIFRDFCLYFSFNHWEPQQFNELKLERKKLRKLSGEKTLGQKHGPALCWKCRKAANPLDICNRLGVVAL